MALGAPWPQWTSAPANPPIAVVAGISGPQVAAQQANPSHLFFCQAASWRQRARLRGVAQVAGTGVQALEIAVTRKIARASERAP